MNTDPPHDNRIQATAAAWVARLASREVSAGEREQFNRWIAASPAHRAAFFALRAHWQGLNEAVRLGAAPKRQRSCHRGLAVAASLVLAVLLYALHPALEDYWLADHVTAAGEQKNLILADGSTVVMNTGTALAVEFDAGTRRIRLLHGEAEFIVAHDPARPFVVVSENRAVTALGTEFSVSRWADEFAVTVFASAVRVTRNGRIVDELKRGHRLLLKGNDPPQTDRHADLDSALAWRRGRLIFTAKPLGEVVAEINRYRRGRLFLLAPAASRRPVSGVFDVDQLDSLLPVMADSLDLKLANPGGYWSALY